MRDDIGQNAPARDTNEKSSEEEVPFIDEVPTLPVVANAAVSVGTQNAVTAETPAPNQPDADNLTSQPQATNNSAVPDEPIQSLAAPPAAIPVVNADDASTVAATLPGQPVAPQRGGAERYDLRPRPKPSTRDAFIIIVVLILLLLLAAGSSPMSPHVGVALKSKNTLNYLASMGNVVQQLLLKCNLASLTTPSKVIKESGVAQEVCGCGRVDTKDPHMLIKPPLEVSQIINDVNVNQRHVRSDGITIVCLHPKCKILPIMAVSIITISCLMSPLSAEILVPRMQIRGERSGWKAVRLQAIAPATAVTKSFL